MGMSEKKTLVDMITLKMVEDYSLPIKEVRAKLTEILQQYHVTISDEAYAGTDLSTKYLMGKFCAGKQAVGMCEKTIMQYKIAVSKLEKFTGKQLSDVEGEDISNFLRQYGKTVSNVTLRGKYQLLSSVYTWLFMHKYIPNNPIMYVDAPKLTVIYKEPLTDLELEKVKQAAENFTGKESLRDMAMIHFFISTGCRVSELCNIKMQDLDLQNKTCKVLGKGRKERPVILTDRAIYRLSLYLETRKDTSSQAPLFAHLRGEEEKMTRDGVERVMHKLRKAAGVSRLTCHTFRRFYATELRRRNVNIQMIARSLGHANLNQIERYSLYDAKELQQVIRNAM